jgi:hypothetical protein
MFSVAILSLRDATEEEVQSGIVGGFAAMGGLRAAKELGILTGGEAPKGFKTEDGSNLELKTIYQIS